MVTRSLIDCELLIREVEKRPALYNFQLDEFGDKSLKEKLWTEVCEALFSGWHDLSPEEKNDTGKIVQRRWKSLKECFRRETQLRKGRLGDSGCKKRKYVYFDQLLFLTRIPRQRRNPGDIFAARSDEDEGIEENATYSENKPQTSVDKSHEEELLSALKNKAHQEIDADQLFFASLVPEFKKLKDDQKIGVKIELLQVIRRAQLLSEEK